jgi:hypothetical protein
MAIATAFKTPEAGEVFSTKYLLSAAQNLYDQLVALKQQWVAELEEPETLENINITSERIVRIQRRVSSLDNFPGWIGEGYSEEYSQKLNTWKETKQVQKLLREYTDGAKAQLDDAAFVTHLVQDTEILNLIVYDGIKASTLQVSLAAIC